jgi:hypothetical protein
MFTIPISESPPRSCHLSVEKQNSHPVCENICEDFLPLAGLPASLCLLRVLQQGLPVFRNDFPHFSSNKQSKPRQKLTTVSISKNSYGTLFSTSA